MKTKSLIINLVSLCLLCSCTADKDNFKSPIKKCGVLQIEVSKNRPSESISRVAYSSLNATFENGDAVGIYFLWP